MAKPKIEDGRDIFEKALDSDYAIPGAAIIGAIAGGRMMRAGGRVARPRPPSKIKSFSDGALGASIGSLAGASATSHAQNVSRKNRKK